MVESGSTESGNGQSTQNWSEECSVYKLIVKDTIEENILKLQEKKRELADQILEGEGLNGGSFTKEELMELLSGK